MVRGMRDGDRKWVAATIQERWGAHLWTGRGREWRFDELSALIAVGEDDEATGLATYAVDGDDCVLVTLDALVPGAGIGRELLDAVAEAARAEGARRVVVMVTNDRTDSMCFYQRAGYRLAELREGAIERARAKHPWMPETGRDGIPLRDEIELARALE
jgi:GNAT superfamily N-acetyltransferase